VEGCSKLKVAPFLARKTCKKHLENWRE